MDNQTDLPTYHIVLKKKRNKMQPESHEKCFSSLSCLSVERCLYASLGR